MKDINDFKVGDTSEFKHVITSDDIQKFANLTGDNNPLHVDRKFAEKTHFKEIVAHGMLSASFISTLVGKHLPGDGALWVSQSLNFLLPVRIGDELTISATIKKIYTAERLLTLQTDVKNQFKKMVLTGEAQVKLLELEEPLVTESNIITEKVILVTGASRGIGAAIAKHIALKGYKVAINYNKDKEGAELVAQEIKDEGGIASIYAADVTNEKDVKKMVAAIVADFGTITALVNNASGKIVSQAFTELSWEDVQSHIDIQIKGAFNCIKEVMPYFVANKMGSIVNMGSIVADNVPTLKWTPYNIAKTGLIALTKSLAVEYGSAGIRVNMVSPGMTDTSLISEIPAKTRMVTAMQTPLRRIALPSDIAKTISFLIDDDAAFITGQNIRVCGGIVMT